MRRQVQLGEVADQPARPGMVLFGGLDERRIDVDAVGRGSEVDERPVDVEKQRVGDIEGRRPPAQRARRAGRAPVRSGRPGEAR